MNLLTFCYICCDRSCYTCCIVCLMSSFFFIFISCSDCNFSFLVKKKLLMLQSNFNETIFIEKSHTHTHTHAQTLQLQYCSYFADAKSVYKMFADFIWVYYYNIIMIVICLLSVCLIKSLPHNLLIWFPFNYELINKSIFDHTCIQMIKQEMRSGV